MIRRLRFRLGARHRAAQFARDVDSLVESGRGLDPDTAAMIELVGQLRAAAGQPVGGTPSPDFRAALRTRLLAVASVSSLSSPEPARRLATGSHGAHRWLRPRWQTFATGLLAGVVALTGIGVAGARALPGDLFYGVKRAGEAIQLRTADGEADVALRHLLQAQARIDEVTALVERDGNSALARELAVAPTGGLVAGSTAAGVNALVQQSLRDMDADVRIGERLMVEAYSTSGDRGLMELLSGWAGSQQPRLAGVVSALPGVPHVTTSIALLEAVEQQAAARLTPGE